MTDADWCAGHVHCLGMSLPGDQIEETGERGERITGDTFVVLFNAHDDPVPFRLGARRRDVSWTTVLDTADSAAPGCVFPHMGIYPLHGRSLAVLRAIVP
jgi:glycogen operon protein